MRVLTDEWSRWSYPSEYLYSRIRGRIDRGLNYIRRDTPEAIRQYIEQEHKWVYLQMNEGLREKLWPFFFFREIRRVSEWLRLGDVSSQLELSLLSEEIKEVFLKTREISLRIEGLEIILSKVSERFFGLKEIFLSRGLKAFEETLMNSFLSLAVSISYRGLKEFFRYLIDFRNLISLYKHIRWGIETMPSFLSEGNIGVTELRKAFLSGDMSKVHQLSRLLDIDIDDLSELEIGLYKGLRGVLKRRYQMLPIEPIVIPYYLWNLYVESLLGP